MQSDTESNVSGFVRYSNKEIKRLYVSAIENMQEINQGVFEIKRNLIYISKTAGPMEDHIKALLRALPQPDFEKLLDDTSDLSR